MARKSAVIDELLDEAARHPAVRCGDLDLRSLEAILRLLLEDRKPLPDVRSKQQRGPDQCECNQHPRLKQRFANPARPRRGGRRRRRCRLGGTWHRTRLSGDLVPGEWIAWCCRLARLPGSPRG